MLLITSTIHNYNSHSWEYQTFVLRERKREREREREMSFPFIKNCGSLIRGRKSISMTQNVFENPRPIKFCKDPL